MGGGRLHWGVVGVLACLASLAWGVGDGSAGDSLVVRGRVLNVRQAPGHEAPKVGALHEGEVIEALEEVQIAGKSWVRFRLPDGGDGWAARWLLDPPQAAGAPGEEAAPQANSAGAVGGATPAWVKVSRGRSLEGLGLDLAGELERVKPLALGLATGQTRYGADLAAAREEDAATNARWERELYAAESELDTVRADYQAADIAYRRASERRRAMGLERDTLVAQKGNYGRILRWIEKSLRRARSAYRTVYDSYRHYVLTLGVVTLGPDDLASSTPEERRQMAMAGAIRAAEKACLVRYVNLVDRLEGDDIRQEIELSESTMHYGLAPSGALSFQTAAPNGTVTSETWLVLAPLCVQPRPLDRRSLGEGGTGGARGVARAEGVVLFEPFKAPDPTTVADVLAKAVDRFELAPPQRARLDEMVRSAADLVAGFHDPAYTRVWERRVREHSGFLRDLVQEKNRYEGILAGLEKQIAGLEARIRQQAGDPGAEAARRQAVVEQMDSALERRNRLLLQRALQFTFVAEENQAEDVGDGQMMALLARRAVKGALRESKLRYRDRVVKYVFADDLETYWSTERTGEMPARIQRFRVVSLGKNGVRWRVAVTFDLELRIPERLLLPFNPLDESLVVESAERVRSEDGNSLLYLEAGGLVWSTGTNDAAGYFSWPEARQEAEAWTRERRYGFPAWRLPTESELNLIRSSGRDGACSLFPDLGVGCGNVVWTGTRVGRSGMGDRYRVVAFGPPKVRTLDQYADFSAKVLLVADPDPGTKGP